MKINNLRVDVTRISAKTHHWKACGAYLSFPLHVMLKAIPMPITWSPGRDVIKQYTVSELLGSLYLNDTHKI